MGKPHIMIATPMFGGQCAGVYTNSCLLLKTYADIKEIGISFAFVMNESIVQRARNTLANQFMRDFSATHLMFIDADMEFKPEDVFSMLDADKDILLGLYPKKTINWNAVHNAAINGESANRLHLHQATMNVVVEGNPTSLQIEYDKPFKVQAGGTGFMLIKRVVFERLTSKVKKYADEFNGLPIECREYFVAGVDDKTGQFVSEDIGFCNASRKTGSEVWAAPWVQLGHFGSHLFKGG